MIELTDETFQQFIDENDFAVIAFYLSWIPNYAEVLNEFEKASQFVHGTDVPHAVLDCVKEKKTYERFLGNYTTWPSIAVFKRSNHLGNVYMGARTPRGISSWVTRQISNTVNNLNLSAKALETFKHLSEVVVIGCFADDDDRSRRVFKSVAEVKSNSYLFGILNDRDKTMYEGGQFPGILLYKDFDERKSTSGLPDNSTELASWIDDMATPLVTEFRGEILFPYLKASTPLGFFSADESDLPKLVQEVAQPLARKYKGKITLGTSNIRIRPDQMWLEHVDVKLPAFAITNPAVNRHYPMKSAQVLTKSEVDNFIQDFLDGKLQPTIRSAPIPAQHGPVVEVVASTWDELVMDNDKDVFLEYYTQTCGPCKALLPELERLAKLYADDPACANKFTIAKVDAEANDVDSFINGFPTFKLFPAGSKNDPKRFDGNRRVEDWQSFIYENGGHRIQPQLNEASSKR